LTFDDRDVTPVHGEREILERVRARGTALRRRKVFARAASAGTLVAVLLAAGIAVAYQGGGPKRAPGGFINNSAPTDSPTPTEETALTPKVTLPTVLPSAEQPSPSAGAPVCLNSYDPACGKFYWDPKPGPNAPIVVTIHPSSNSLTIGETVTVTVTAVDSDAPIACDVIEWGPTYIGTAVTMRAQFGRWEPPRKKGGSITLTFTHAYKTAGTHQILFTAVSGSSCVDPSVNPYSSSDSASATVTVSETPSPSVSPSPSPSVSESPSPSPSP
jgi:hypothetical protein